MLFLEDTQATIVSLGRDCQQAGVLERDGGLGDRGREDRTVMGIEEGAGLGLGVVGRLDRRGLELGTWGTAGRGWKGGSVSSASSQHRRVELPRRNSRSCSCVGRGHRR